MYCVGCMLVIEMDIKHSDSFYKTQIGKLSYLVHLFKPALCPWHNVNGNMYHAICW